MNPTIEFLYFSSYSFSPALIQVACLLEKYCIFNVRLLNHLGQDLSIFSRQKSICCF